MNPLSWSGVSALCPELTGREVRPGESELKGTVAPEARTVASLPGKGRRFYPVGRSGHIS